MAKDEKAPVKTKKYVPDHESRHKLPTKVVIRHLPPTMTEEDFLKQTDPLPPHDFYYFAAADWSLGSDATCRAYITFKHYDDILLFRDRFDGYVFVDSKGDEYIAIVEFAPFQHVLRNKSRNGDNKINTIEDDSHYQNFLKRLEEEREAASKGGECKLEFSLDHKKEEIASTPLLVYLANKKEKRREDTRKRTLEKKRQREDEQQAGWPHVDTNSKAEETNKSKENASKMSRSQRRAERNRRRVEEYTKRFGENKAEPADKTDRDDRKRLRRNRKTKISPAAADKEPKKTVEILKKPSVEDLSESVRNFIIKAAQTIHPNSNQEPTTSNKKDNASITSNLNQLEEGISKLDLNGKDNNLKKSRQSCNESAMNRSAKQKQLDEKREERRIRNKDRPSIEIYQPKPLLRLSGENEGNTNSKDIRSQPTSDCENHKISAPIQQSEPQRYRKVQRYSERNRNRNRTHNTSIDIKINKEMRA